MEYSSNLGICRTI